MARRSFLPKILHAPLDQTDVAMRIPDRRMIKRLFGDPPLAQGDNEEDYWDLFDFLCEEARPLSGLDLPFLLNLTSLLFEDRRLRDQKEALIRLELPDYISRVLRRGGYKDEDAARITRRWQRGNGTASRDLERRLRNLDTSLSALRSEIIFKELDRFRALDDLSAQNHRRCLQLRQELDRSKRFAFDEVLLRIELKSKIAPPEDEAAALPEKEGFAGYEDMSASSSIEEPKVDDEAV